MDDHSRLYLISRKFNQQADRTSPNYHNHYNGREGLNMGTTVWGYINTTETITTEYEHTTMNHNSSYQTLHK